jgi:hypothetical protein
MGWAGATEAVVIAVVVVVVVAVAGRIGGTWLWARTARCCCNNSCYSKFCWYRICCSFWHAANWAAVCAAVVPVMLAVTMACGGWTAVAVTDTWGGWCCAVWTCA